MISKYNNDTKMLTALHTGLVKQVSDTKRSGRIKVWVPALESDEYDESSWITCEYCSPFAGSTNWQDNSREIFDTAESSQSSYGFWAVPPDINNEVLIVFPNADVSKALWIGCVYKEYMNYMVPAIASSAKNKNKPGAELPVGEYNKFDVVSGDATNPISPVRPWHAKRTHSIGKQGLIRDTIRGITKSSAQRDKISAVYGMSTPGPVDEDALKNKNIKGARKGGHSFVMDDSPDHEYIGLRTRSGSQLLIDETNGLVYAINRDGTSWMQMDADGNFDVFAAGSISLRAQKDFNLRADGNVNIEAGQNVNIKAAKDTDKDYKYVGAGEGKGGKIGIQSNDNLSIFSAKKMLVNSGTLIVDTDGNVVSKDFVIAGELTDPGLPAGPGDIPPKLDGTTVSGQFSLASHAHISAPPLSPTSTLILGTTPLTPALVASNPPLPAVSAINVLNKFPETTIKTDGGRNVKMPDYWNRETEEVDTIVKRMPTYEPSPIHKKS